MLARLGECIDFLSTHPQCHLAPWTFEWAPDGTSNPGDNILGPAGSPWTPFTSTANKTILMTPTTTCGLRGGKIDVIYMGGGLWQTTGILYGSGTAASAFKN